MSLIKCRVLNFYELFSFAGGENLEFWFYKSSRFRVVMVYERSEWLSFSFKLPMLLVQGEFVQYSRLVEKLQFVFDGKKYNC